MAVVKPVAAREKTRSSKSIPGLLVLHGGRTRNSLPRGLGAHAEIKLKPDEMAHLERHAEATRQVLKEFAAALKRMEAAQESIDLRIKVEADAPGVIAKVQDKDVLDKALARARERGAHRVADIMKSEDMLTARGLGEVLGLSHETVNQKRRSGEVLGLQGVKRGVRYPRWQVVEGGRLLPGLKAVFGALGGDPWRVYRFLLSRHNELGGATALDVLKAERLDEVLAVAGNLSSGVFA